MIFFILKDGEFFMSNLTPEQEKERKQQAKQAIHDSKKLMKDFKVYLAVFSSETRRQVSLLTKEEYEKMQQMKYIGSKHEEKFFDGLPDDDNYVDVKTLTLDKNNFGLAFYPMVWNVLTLAQKVAICRIVRQQTENKDFKQFHVFDSNGVVMCGNDFKGALNIGSFFRDDMIGPDFLTKLLNGQNTIDDSYYVNKLRNGAKYNEIKDFNSLIEMQYISPLEPKTDNLEEMPPKAKAFYFDQIYRRKYRKAKQQALDYITEHAGELEGLWPEFDSAVAEEQKHITQTDLLVMQELGSNQKMRDEEYLKVKVDIFNNIFIEEYNKLAKKHNEILEEYNNSKDAIETKGLKEKLHKIQDELEIINSKLTTIEKAKEHFKSHFETSINIQPTKQKPKHTLSKEEYEKMN